MPNGPPSKSSTAFPYDEAPRFLLRDRDGIYGDYFKKRVKDMGIEEVLIAPRAPWQNPFCELASRLSPKRVFCEGYGMSIAGSRFSERAARERPP